jgi:integrase
MQDNNNNNQLNIWTDKQIQSIQPIDKRFRLAETTRQRGTGRLVLDVQPNGIKTFFFKYSRKLDDSSKRIHLKIGLYRKNGSGLTLSDARDKAKEYSDLIKKGIDPKEFLEEQFKLEQEKRRQKEAAKNQATFGQLLDAYIAKMEATGKRSFVSTDKSLTTYVRKPYPELIKIKANEIETKDLTKILSRMMKNGVTTHSNRVRSYLHAAFQHGLKQENNPRDFLEEPKIFNIKHNPVTQIPVQEDFERVGEHFLEKKEIKIIWNNIEPEVTSVLLKLAICTGQRVGELRKVPLKNLNLTDRWLLIDKTLSKNKRDHLIPLTGLSLKLLRDWVNKINGSQYLFPSLKSSWKHIEKMEDKTYIDMFNLNTYICGSTVERHINKFLKNHNDVEKFIPKDIRRTVKTYMAEDGIDKWIRDKIQNHVNYDVAEKNYNRHDYFSEKLQGIKKWNSCLNKILKKKYK